MTNVVSLVNFSSIYYCKTIIIIFLVVLVLKHLWLNAKILSCPMVILKSVVNHTITDDPNLRTPDLRKIENGHKWNSMQCTRAPRMVCSGGGKKMPPLNFIIHDLKEGLTIKFDIICLYNTNQTWFSHI